MEPVDSVVYRVTSCGSDLRSVSSPMMMVQALNRPISFFRVTLSPLCTSFILLLSLLMLLLLLCTSMSSCCQSESKSGSSRPVQSGPVRSDPILLLLCAPFLSSLRFHPNSMSCACATSCVCSGQNLKQEGSVLRPPTPGGGGAGGSSFPFLVRVFSDLLVRGFDSCDNQKHY